MYWQAVCLMVRKTNTMLHDNFCMNRFKPSTDEQISLLEDIKTVKSLQGTPKRLTILRSIARTRKFTKTTYPPDWKFA